MQHNYLLLTGRLVSVLIWILVFRYALPLLQLNISRATALIFSLIMGGVIFFFDYFLFILRKQGQYRQIVQVLSPLRFLGSIGMAWLGGYAFSLIIFWETSRMYRPTPYSRRYVETFLNMVQQEGTVILTLFFSVVALLLLDNIGRLANLFVQQKEVVVKQEQTIQKQETVLKQQTTELTHAYQQQLDLVAGIQHELGGKLSVVKNTLADLDIAFHELEQKLPGFSMSRKIRMRLHGESESDVDSFADLVHRMHAALNYSLATVQNIRGIIHADPGRFLPEVKYFLSWLKQEVPKHLPATLPVEVSFTGDNPELKADYKQLSILVHNLVENAVRHGFGNALPPHRLLFCIESQGAQKTCKCYNSGNGLPSGFSVKGYFEPGKTFGGNGNSGLGGYLIGLIAQSHGATVSMQPSDLPDYATLFTMQFSNTL